MPPAGTLVAVFAVWSGGRPVKVEATLIGKATNVAVSCALPACLGAALLWSSWRGSRLLGIGLDVAAVLVYANLAYYVARLWNVATSRP